jgi:hypothetical protein
MRKLLIALIASTPLFTSAPDYILNQRPVPPVFVTPTGRQTTLPWKHLPLAMQVR